MGITGKKINFFTSCSIHGRQEKNCYLCVFGENGACPIPAKEAEDLSGVKKTPKKMIELPADASW